MRYLVDDGAEVKEGEPFAEAEAMKMIITLKATGSGTVKLALQPGSMIHRRNFLVLRLRTHEPDLSHRDR